MIISVNWLKQYTDIDIPVDELVTLIGERLVEVESVESLAEKYKDVVVAKVVECQPLEGSDHLSVTKIDDGRVVKGVERDENGLVQVVCGAPNVKAGQTVAWLPPKSIVPETFNADAQFELGAKLLRGVMSSGMLASAKELGLYEDHSGILIIDKPAEPGTSFAELYELNDYLLDIENKSLTHRPDAFGVIGFAREVAGIQGKMFSTPDWLQVLEPTLQKKGDLKAPKVEIVDKTLSDRFQTIVLSGINEKAQSPLQLQTYLARSGVRPISAAVDISNYLMLLTGQPSHTYDYDKFLAVAAGDPVIRVRSAEPNETLVLLDGKTVELDEADIVIAAGKTAIGLAGAMGGASTTVDDKTKRVLLESATFNLYRLRSTQMRHGLFSEALTRFTKGIPAALSAPLLAEATRLLGEHANAVIASDVSEAYPGKKKVMELIISEQQINDTLGTNFTAEDIASLLGNVGFGVRFDKLVATVTVPYWREDIHIPEDIIEEVGRLAGFDTINLTLPSRDFVATMPGRFDQLRSQLRQLLVRSGANEVLTYSFVHGDTIRRAGQDPDGAYRIINSISPELQYYRQSLTPSLLNLVHPNVKAGYEQFALFELNKTHNTASRLDKEKVPVEHDRIALVLTQSKGKHQTPYYAAKRYLDYIALSLGIELDYQPLHSGANDDPSLKPYEPKRSAIVTNKDTGGYIGVVGEFKASVQKAWKLPILTAGFEINPRGLQEAVERVGQRYQALSRYPGTERDICFQVDQVVSYQLIVDHVVSALSQTKLLTSIQPVDIYKAEGSSTKNVTIRLSLASYDKTLTSEEVAVMIDSVINKVVKATKAKVI